MKNPLTEADIQVGKLYVGKKRLGDDTYNNDRVVVWISPNRTKVQYDSHMVRMGRKLPVTSMQAFLNWAKEVSPERKER